MSSIKVEMFPALQGDCFLISFNDEKKTHILIDGGFEETYHQFLKNRLIEIAEKGEEIALLVVTHIDADHIEGIIELFKENQTSEESQVIKIKEVWHNSFRHLQLKKQENVQINSVEKNILNGIVAGGKTIREVQEIKQSKDISAKQGSTLAALLYHGEYNWNNCFNQRAINCDTYNQINLTSNIRLRILSPNSDKLKKLGKYWMKELEKKKYDFTITDDRLFDDAFEFFMLNQQELFDIIPNKDVSDSKVELDFEELLKKRMVNDYAAPNGSSISFIIEYKDKKLLFLGDSHSSLIYDELKKLVNDLNYDTKFDVIKVSHHGSHKNNHLKLLELIDAPQYLISTNGEDYNHPDLETIARIVCRKRNKECKLVFNYNTKNTSLIDNHKLKEKYKYEVQIPSGINSTIVEI
ncbi:TPA: AVAST type 1 anti-phage system MBL fold metallo-hydrolase Avs1a [Bacillus cereus]